MNEPGHDEPTTANYRYVVGYAIGGGEWGPFRVRVRVHVLAREWDYEFEIDGSVAGNGFEPLGDESAETIATEMLDHHIGLAREMGATGIAWERAVAPASAAAYEDWWKLDFEAIKGLEGATSASWLDDEEDEEEVDEDGEAVE